MSEDFHNSNAWVQKEWTCPECQSVIKAYSDTTIMNLQELHRTRHSLERKNGTFVPNYRGIVRSGERLELTPEDIGFLKECGIGVS